MTVPGETKIVMSVANLTAKPDGSTDIRIDYWYPGQEVEQYSEGWRFVFRGHSGYVHVLHLLHHAIAEFDRRWQSSVLGHLGQSGVVGIPEPQNDKVMLGWRHRWKVEVRRAWCRHIVVPLAKNLTLLAIWLLQTFETGRRDI